jgi:adenine deaminase
LIWQTPQAELHIHIEGSLEPEMMFRLAGRNHITLPYPSVQAVQDAYNFQDLQSFLDLYYAGANVLQSRGKISLIRSGLAKSGRTTGPPYGTLS